MSQPDEVVLGAIAFTDPDEHRVSLCEGFWRREGSLGLSASDRALVLVHEAFHMYFAGTDNGRSMWNASCIEIFVADLNNIRPSEFSSAEDCCKPGAVCALL